MKKYLLLFCLCGSVLLNAQEVSGFWKGQLTFTGGCFPQNNIELQVTEKGGYSYGSSYHYLDVNNYIRKDARGTWDPSDKKLVIQETVVTEQKLVDRCSICVKKFQLHYRREGDREYLDGYWTGKLQNSNEDCGTGGTITLSRISVPTFKEEIIPTFPVDTGEIRLNFYDNGTVDGDSITVLVNRQVVLSHKKLSDVPATALVKVSLETTYVEVEMRAENLGSIPPNTALLEIIAGTTYHRINLTSTKSKSAKVRFVYDKEGAKKSSAVGRYQP